MPTTPREELAAEKKRLKNNPDVSDADKDAILELVGAYDELEFDTPVPMKENGQQDSHRAPLTLTNWIRCLKKSAEKIELTNASAKEINQYTKWVLKERGLAKNTVRKYQDTLRVFHEYHDFGVERTDIATVKQEDTKIRPEDMLTKEEIHDLRDACDHPRDKAIFDLFMYTGQRSYAIRTLRIKDIDIGNGRYRLNPNVDGLKGADENGDTRPLLLAQASVARWVNEYHPDPEPEHYVICSKGKYNKADPTTPTSRHLPQKAMSKLKERTNIEKPVNPHALRHNFVSLAINEYGLDPSTVKYLIGHSKDSRVMETTYQHISGEDHSKKAEIEFDLREPDDDSSTLTPNLCPKCGEPLPPDAKACYCGVIITPDAADVKEQVETDTYHDKGEADGDEEDALDELRALVNKNPELIERLTELSND